MKLQAFLDDDDAVSPVIGVILMVAITVILAAVIASFVLGLGNQTAQSSPQASMSVQYEDGSGFTSWDGFITVTHDSGDSIPKEQLYLRGDGFATTSNVGWLSNQTWAGYASGGNGTISGSSEGQPAVVAGDDLNVTANSDYDVRVIWEAPEGDDSNTLREDTGPDA